MIVPMIVHTKESFFSLSYGATLQRNKETKKYLLSDMCVISLALGKAWSFPYKLMLF